MKRSVQHETKGGKKVTVMLSGVSLVYQDCVECEPVASRLAPEYEVAKAAGIVIEKMPFFKDGADKLIRKAAKANITLPFFSDGEKVSKHIVDLLDADDVLDEEDAKTTKIKKKR